MNQWASKWCAEQLHVQCHKEVAASVCGGLQQALRVLKAWVLLGPSFASREEHMHISQKKMLVNSLNEGTLMTEEELDMHAGLADEAAAPFQESEMKHASSSNPLGKPSDGVSEAFHAEMEEMARAGKIPMTSPEQELGTNWGLQASILCQSLEAGASWWLYPPKPSSAPRPGLEVHSRKGVEALCSGWLKRGSERLM